MKNENQKENKRGERKTLIETISSSMEIIQLMHYVAQKPKIKMKKKKQSDNNNSANRIRNTIFNPLDDFFC